MQGLKVVGSEYTRQERLYLSLFVYRGFVEIGSPGSLAKRLSSVRLHIGVFLQMFLETSPTLQPEKLQRWGTVA